MSHRVPVPTPAPTPTCVDMDYSGQAGSPTYYTCATYPTWCPSYYHDDDFSADFSSDMCCSCGGGGVFGQLPSPIPTITRRPTPRPRPAPMETTARSRRTATTAAAAPMDRHTRLPSSCPTYYEDDDWSVSMCCMCGGGYNDGKIPSPVPTPGSPEPTVTLTPTRPNDLHRWDQRGILRAHLRHHPRTVRPGTTTTTSLLT